MAWKKLEAQGVRRCCAIFTSGRRCARRASGADSAEPNFCSKHAPVILASRAMAASAIEAERNHKPRGDEGDEDAVAARRRADAEATMEAEAELRAAEAYRDDFPAGEYEVDAAERDAWAREDAEAAQAKNSAMASSAIEAERNHKPRGDEAEGAN